MKLARIRMKGVVICNLGNVDWAAFEAYLGECWPFGWRSIFDQHSDIVIFEPVTKDELMEIMHDH